jgi:hypothetical protein
MPVTVCDALGVGGRISMIYGPISVKVCDDLGGAGTNFYDIWWYVGDGLLGGGGGCGCKILPYILQHSF